MNQVPGSHLYLRLSGRLFRRKAFKDLSVIEQKEGGDVSGAEVQIRISAPCFFLTRVDRATHEHLFFA